MLRRHALVALAVLTTGASLTVGCTDEGQASQAAASEVIDAAIEAIDRDTEQLRKGMPEGVKVLVKRMPDDPQGSRLELQTAIKSARENTDKLAVAKSTFFSFVDLDGKVLRSEIDPDRLVDQNILQAFPPLTKALDPKSGVVEAFGSMDALRGVKRGDDLAWVVAHPVVDTTGKTKGLFVSGFSFRLYAGLLQGAVRARATEKAKDKASKKVPLFYAFLVKGGTAYGGIEPAVGPQGVEVAAPDVLAEHLTKQDLAAKTASADFASTVEVEKRKFGFVARRAPALGEDAVVVVVASVF
jgi:hypothetical protein